MKFNSQTLNGISGTGYGHEQTPTHIGGDNRKTLFGDNIISPTMGKKNVFRIEAELSAVWCRPLCICTEAD